MIANQALMLILAFAAGIVFGVIFFGGLYWTVRKGMLSPSPATWFLASWLLRMVVVVAGFYFVSGGQLSRLLLCLLGFFIARLLITRLSPLLPLEAHHAA